MRARDPEGLRKKVKYVRESARKYGRDPDDVEIGVWVPFVKITDDPEIEKYGKEYGASNEEISD